MKLKLVLQVILFLLLLANGKAQKDSVLSFNKQEWEEITKGINYTETFKEVKPEKQESSVKNTSPRESAFGDDFKYVFYILGFALILLLIVLVFKNFKTNTPLKESSLSAQTIDELEEKIHELDLDDLLKQAMQSGQYKLALRIHFLIIIKQLSTTGKIIWAKEKTNWEYYSEIKEKQMAAQFKEVMSKFEKCWYGEQPFSEEEFKLIEPIFLSIQNKLSANG